MPLLEKPAAYYDTIYAAVKEAFLGAGLGVTHDPDGLMGRGLYIGAKPAVP
jgi:hypothetical protein